MNEEERGVSPDLSRAEWRKATRSTNDSNCVEIAFVEGVTAIRDSKDPNGPALVFNRGEWSAFLDGAKNGEFDLAD